MRDPVWVYDIWSAYTDGFYQEFLNLPDETRLTEELAMRQLGELVRLKRSGVHFDYFMMNAFWFDPDGAYRQWRRADWPEGPDRWIAACHQHGLKPGLWFGTNSLWKINPPPQWADSLAPPRTPSAETIFQLNTMSLYEGGFLADFMSTLQYWYERGIRLFEFDVADFDAATAEAMKTQSPQEIRESNRAVFSAALQEFRRRNPDAMLVAFNDFGGDIHGTATPFPFKRPVDLRWLEVFDTLYTGDIRVSDVPLMSFWRSVDLYNDHMTRRYEQAGVCLERSDPFFTLSSTWFGYKRGKQAWKSMLLLSAARGSWKKTIYGDLTLLDDEDARWFAKVQQLYAPLSALGRTKSFGAIPGEAQPYGFASLTPQAALYTIVNPTQQTSEVRLPALSRIQSALKDGRVLFSDAGFVPQLDGAQIVLGPEQMAVVGFGQYAHSHYDLGIEQDVVIPQRIAAVEASFHVEGANSIAATVMAPAQGDLRVVFQQRSAEGTAPRSPVMKIVAEQNGAKVPVAQPDQDRAVSTGISWGVGEIRRDSFRAGQPITITCTCAEKTGVVLEARCYVLDYSSGKE